MIESLEDFVEAYVLPKGVLEYFVFKGSKDVDGKLHINLEEKNIVPEECIGKTLESKGFFQTKTIQDFPLRGKPVLLRVKQRRWIDKNTGKYITRDWNLVMEGTKLTKEFAGFLKELDRD